MSYVSRTSLPSAAFSPAHSLRFIQDADNLLLLLAMARQLKGRAKKQTREEKRSAAARRLKAKEDFVNFYLPIISVLLLVLLVLFIYYY